MIINTETSLCNDLIVIALQDGKLDISWAIDTNKLKEILSENYSKILNLHENINFDIEIDNVDTFDSINLKQFTFDALTDKYIGNIVFSAVIPFNKNQFEETTYYFRVKIKNSETTYLVNDGTSETIQINDIWTEPLKFNVPKNYTKDIVEIMYNIVADSNSYNKEVKSANFYYLFQAFGYTLNKEFHSLLDVKNSNFLYKSKPDYLLDTFGILFKFTNVNNISMEEYRRILAKLIVGYQNGGAWNYIKEVLQYFIGYYPELTTFNNFYPWILRTKEMLGINIQQDEIENSEDNPTNYAISDPTNWNDRNYYNPNSRYYAFSSSFPDQKNNNNIMLLDSGFKKFTFVVKTDNFFNRDIDANNISNVLDILKSAYTKYILNIYESTPIEDINITNALMSDTNNAILENDDNYIVEH